MPKITFRSRDEVVPEAFPTPVPAETVIPSWFRRQAKYVGGKRGWMSRGEGARLNQTVRACPIVQDSMASGYLMRTPCDIHVTPNPDGQAATFDVASGAYCTISAHHAIQMSEMEFDRHVFYDHAYKLQGEWVIKTPKGYSALIMHPMYRGYTPFQTLPGLIDTDRYVGGMNVIFRLRRDFEGVIPVGTPIAQVIPFRREDWVSEIVAGTPAQWSADYLKSESKFRGAYRRFAYTKKSWK